MKKQAMFLHARLWRSVSGLAHKTRKNKMKKLWIAIFAVVGLALAAQASTIVKWGEPGGANNIVTNSGRKGAAAGSTYAVVSPADGAGGYSTNVVGQTRIVYGASTESWNATLIINHNAGDYMQLVKNYSGAVGTFTTMLAWEDFLTTSITKTPIRT